MNGRTIAVIATVVALGWQSVYAQGRARDERQEEGTYSSFNTNFTSSPSWQIGGTNFGMGAQILLRNSLNGRLWTTYMFADGSQAYSTNNSLTVNAMSMLTNVTGLITNGDSAVNWSVDTIADVNGDGKDEAILTKTVSGQNYKKVLFFGDNGTATSAGAVWQNGSQWVLEGAGRFNANSYTFKSNTKGDQIMLRNSSNGRLWTTYISDAGSQAYDATNANYSVTANAMSMMTNVSGLITNGDSAVNWTLDAIGDVNGDAKDEAILAKTVSGQTYKKTLFFGDNGTATSASTVWQNGSQWQIQGMGRFDVLPRSFNSSTNSQQLLLRNTSNGRLWLTYFMNSGAQAYDATNAAYAVTANPMSLMTNVPGLIAEGDSAVNWTVQGIGDVNKDGRDDVVIAKAVGSQLYKKTLFFGDNGTVTSASSAWVNGTQWIVEGLGNSKK